MENDLKVFSGNSNRSLALEICQHIGISNYTEQNEDKIQTL